MLKRKKKKTITTTWNW